MTDHCSDCAMCCRLLKIPELEKPAGKWCDHCKPATPHPCTIYDRRPQVCREFACVWLQSQSRPGEEMPASLRPDRSKAVLTAPGGSEMGVICDPTFPDAWRKGVLWQYIQKFTKAGGTVRLIVGERAAEITS